MEQMAERLWGSNEQDQWGSSPHPDSEHTSPRRNVREFPKRFRRMTHERRVVPSDMGTGVDPEDALKSLDNIKADSREMGYPVPDVTLVAEAKRILIGMQEYRPASFDAYSMDDGRVAIGVDGDFGRSMLIVCEPGGSALCVVTVNRVSRRARYGDSGFLPDDFVRQGLRDLTKATELAAERFEL